LNAFATSLRLTNAQARAVEVLIDRVGANSRDEIAKLALTWAYAKSPPGRMVISGEHFGAGLYWGRNRGGTITIENIRALSKVFPMAAAAIEDLHVSACYSARGISDWPTVFPKVQTIWAYGGSAPGSYTGATKHMQMWDRATRGNKRRIDRAIAKDSRKGENVVVWSQLYGLETGVVEPIDALRARLNAGEATFSAFFAGDSVVTDPQTGPLRDLYNDLQAMLRHPDLPPGEKPALERKRDVTIRLLYYDKTVKARFAFAYKPIIDGGYAALAIAAPNFGSLSRKAALVAIAQVAARAGANRAPAIVSLLQHLTEGLRDLGERYIPANWI
jgi:hypothetical protein